MDKPIIKICSYCVNEFGLSDVMKNHYVKLRTQITFTHGTCKRHYIQAVMSQVGLSQAEAEENSKKVNWDNAPPDLKDHPELLQQYKEGNFMTPETQPLNEAATEQDVTMLKIINKYDQRKMAVLYKLQEQLQKSVQSNPAYKSILNMIGDVISKQRLGEGWWDSAKAKMGQYKTQRSDYQIKSYANVLRKEYKGMVEEVGTAFGMPASENVIVQLVKDNAIKDRPLLPQTIQKFVNSLQMYYMLIETLDQINTVQQPKVPAKTAPQATTGTAASPASFVWNPPASSSPALKETFVSGPLGSENFKVCRKCEIEFGLDPHKLPGAVEGTMFHGTCSRHAVDEWMKRMKMTLPQAQAAIAKSLETASKEGNPITPDLRYYPQLVARYKKT